MIRQNCLIFGFLVFLLTAGCYNGQRRDVKSRVMIRITDMAGRQADVPETITKVICADMTATSFMYALAPEMLCGRNMKASDAERSVIPESFTGLPVIGVIFYGKSTFNIEAAANLHPDVLLCPLFQHTTAEYIADYEEFGRRLGVPVVMVALDLEKLPEAFRFMGKLLDREEQAAKLASYAQETLDWAGFVRSNIRDTLSVYMAEGTTGLNTIPAGSTHSQVIEMAGAGNCATVDEAYGYKAIPVSFEQIMNWKPDYVILNSRMSAEEQTGLLSKMRNDRVWQSLDAVKEGSVLVVPVVPFNWIGRPPGINRLIGIRWLAASLYPAVAQINITEEVDRFFSLFYHVRLSTEDVRTVLKMDSVIISHDER